MLKTIWKVLARFTNKINQTISRFSIPIIVIIACVMRIWVYGDLNLSIAGNDTMSFIESSRVPWFSREMLTGQRLLATNLLYKAFEPEDGYKILVNGSIETTSRKFQVGLNKIAVAQTVFSIIGWGCLALSVSEHIKNSSIKNLSSFLILLFAFTPQVADWDSILMSESLNFSLFALQLAILIKLAFLMHKDPNIKAIGWFILWAFSYFLWTFVRPTNLFIAPVTFTMCAGLLLYIRFRKSNYIYSALIFSILVFTIGFVTTGNSSRSLNYDVYIDDLLPYPTRVAILQGWGMPAPDSPEFQPWFKTNSTKTLVRFMVTYPGYPITKIIKDFPFAFTEIKQTYFSISGNKGVRNTMLLVGEALHPENTTPFLLGLILLIGIINLANINQGNIQPWAWIGTWIFLSASVSLVLSIIGDTWGLNRHALLSTTSFRLCMWLFSIIILDIALDQSKNSLRPQNP